MEIAMDTDKCNEAEERFSKLVYALGSLQAKVGKIKLWNEVTKAMAVEPLPVTPVKVMRVAAVLRDAGYRSGIAYIHQAVQQHARAGYPVDDALSDRRC